VLKNHGAASVSENAETSSDGHLGTAQGAEASKPESPRFAVGGCLRKGTASLIVERAGHVDVVFRHHTNLSHAVTLLDAACLTRSSTPRSLR